MSQAHRTPRSAAEQVVSAEVEVCREKAPAAPLSEDARPRAEELYKSLTMGADAYRKMLSLCHDPRLKTDMTEALSVYEELTAETRALLLRGGGEVREEGPLPRMAARMGMTLNALKDDTDSHLAEMLIEGCTMSVTTARKLLNHAEGKPHCAALAALCHRWETFEEAHIERLKVFL